MTAVWMHEELCSSTQDVARREWNGQSCSCVIVTADQQTAGRGTWGRSWWSNQGNLLLSMACSISDQSLPDLPRRVSLCIAEAMRQHGLHVTLKGVNDLMLPVRSSQAHDRVLAKVCGVLVESWTGARGRGVCIGIGLNCRQAPPSDLVGQATTCLIEHGFDWNPRMAATFVLRAVWPLLSLPGSPPDRPHIFCPWSSPEHAR
jgi:biotin-[acetyl-CoA-carboxylase] ligase BirA-like protein